MNDTWTEVNNICNIIKAGGGLPLLVGGCVRDMLIGANLNISTMSPHVDTVDFDIEVFNLNYEQIHALLAPNYKLELVGKSFGVLKLKDYNIDVSVPRIETKTGEAHTDFTVQFPDKLSVKEAAARRDFTINAIYYDPLAKAIFDPYNGLDDLRAGLLRPTSEQFKEDHLRVLRAMQFIARFNLTPHKDLLEQARQMTQAHLHRDRIFEEWKKLLLKGNDIKAGLDFLKEVGWIERFYPDLHRLVGCEQTPAHHPEGDVFTHTGHCLNHFSKIRRRLTTTSERLIVGFAVLTHDIAKPHTSVRHFHTVDGKEQLLKITTVGHEQQGVEVSRAFISTLTDSVELLTEPQVLVRWHMAPCAYYTNNAGDEALLKLAFNAHGFYKLSLVVECDQYGRPPRVPNKAALEWFKEQAIRLGVVYAPRPRIINGNHLQQAGFTPGPAFTPLLEHLYFLQLRGRFTNEAEGVLFLEKNKKTLMHFITDKK